MKELKISHSECVIKMEWKYINVKDRKPTKEDSPILAWCESIIDEYYSCAAVQWLDEEDGWNGEGWYEHSLEYGIREEEIKWWMPLPIPPKE